MKAIINIYRESFRGLTSQVWILALIMLINRMGTLILPFLTLYTTQKLGWGKAESGYAAASFAVGSLFGALIGGWLVDRIGYYKIVIISLFGAGFSFFVLMFFQSFYPLCIGLLLASMISDTIRPAVMAAVSKICGPETRTRGISLMRMAFNLGLAIGPAFAGVIIAATSYNSIFIIDAVTCILAGVFAIFFLNRDYVDPSIASDKKIIKHSPYRDKPFILFMLWTLIMLVAFFQILSTVPLFMKEQLYMSEIDVGIFFGINGLLIFISEMPIVYFTEKKWRLMPAMVLGSVMIGISYLFLIWQGHPWAIIIMFAVLISYGEIVNFPFISSLALRRTNPNNVGKYMGLVAVIFSLSLIFAPIFGTQIIESYGYPMLWSSCAILCTIAAIGWWRLDQDFKKKEKTAEA